MIKKDFISKDGVLNLKLVDTQKIYDYLSKNDNYMKVKYVIYRDTYTGRDITFPLNLVKLSTSMKGITINTISANQLIITYIVISTKGIDYSTKRATLTD